MSDKCVACGEVAEGKPLYKKLGSSDCQVEVFTALHEMELLSLPPEEKNNHYICWDCDETIAEEYANFLATEAKKAAVEAKRKQQDEARKVKLQKKLKQAFKKAHNDALRASGVHPPVSKYKMKEKQREENKYHAMHCLMCKESFETSKARGYQRFTLNKMVDDDYDVADVLEKLGFNLDIPAEQRRKRFVCCQCYNKMRRNYKALSKGQNTSESFQSPMNLQQTGEQPGEVFKRRPTTEEHAAEIAKLIPPSLANLYKVVTEEEGSSTPRSNHKSPKGRLQHKNEGSRKSERSRKGKKRPRSSSPSSDESSSSSSSSSSEDVSEENSSSSDDASSSDSPESPPIPKKSKKKQDIEQQKNKKRKRGRQMFSKPKLKKKRKTPKTPPKTNGNMTPAFYTASPKTPTIRTLLPKGSNEFGSCESDVATPVNISSRNSEVVDFGICNLCGLGYNARPKDFWYTLSHLMPSVMGVTVLNALQILDSELAEVSQSVREKELVCKPCFSRVCKGFRSQILQRIAEKKGIDVNKLELSKIKVKMMGNLMDSMSDSPSGAARDDELKKINGAFNNNNIEVDKKNEKLIKLRSTEKTYDPPSRGKSGDSKERVIKINSNKKGSKNVTKVATKDLDKSKYEGKSKTSPKNNNSKKNDISPNTKRDKRFQSPNNTESSPAKSHKAKDQKLFKFRRRSKAYRRSLTAIQHDLDLISLINESQHLRYKGKVVLLSSVTVNVADLRGILPKTATTDMDTIRLERFGDIYQFSNFRRNLKQKSNWNQCIICQRGDLGINKTTRWLEDPVAPPNLMVPLRWAQLSIGSAAVNSKLNLAAEDGKVCKNCHLSLKENFGKFVGSRVAVSHGLSSEKVVLDKYKVSFDSVAMNIVADPLESSPQKETKKQKKEKEDRKKSPKKIADKEQSDSSGENSENDTQVSRNNHKMEISKSATSEQKGSHSAHTTVEEKRELISRESDQTEPKCLHESSQDAEPDQGEKILPKNTNEEAAEKASKNSDEEDRVSQGNLSMDLALSDSSDSEDEASHNTLNQDITSTTASEFKDSGKATEEQNVDPQQGTTSVNKTFNSDLENESKPNNSPEDKQNSSSLESSQNENLIAKEHGNLSPAKDNVSDKEISKDTLEQDNKEISESENSSTSMSKDIASSDEKNKVSDSESMRENIKISSKNVSETQEIDAKETTKEQICKKKNTDESENKTDSVTASFAECSSALASEGETGERHKTETGDCQTHLNEGKNVAENEVQGSTDKSEQKDLGETSIDEKPEQNALLTSKTNSEQAPPSPVEENEKQPSPNSDDKKTPSLYGNNEKTRVLDSNEGKTPSSNNNEGKTPILDNNDGNTPDEKIQELMPTVEKTKDQSLTVQGNEEQVTTVEEAKEEIPTAQGKKEEASTVEKEKEEIPKTEVNKDQPSTVKETKDENPIVQTDTEQASRNDKKEEQVSTDLINRPKEESNTVGENEEQKSSNEKNIEQTSTAEENEEQASTVDKNKEQESTIEEEAPIVANELTGNENSAVERKNESAPTVEVDKAEISTAEKNEHTEDVIDIAKHADSIDKTSLPPEGPHSSIQSSAENDNEESKDSDSAPVNIKADSHLSGKTLPAPDKSIKAKTVSADVSEKELAKNTTEAYQTPNEDLASENVALESNVSEHKQNITKISIPLKTFDQVDKAEKDENSDADKDSSGSANKSPINISESELTDNNGSNNEVSGSKKRKNGEASQSDDEFVKAKSLKVTETTTKSPETILPLPNSKNSDVTGIQLPKLIIKSMSEVAAKLSDSKTIADAAKPSILKRDPKKPQVAKRSSPFKKRQKIDQVSNEERIVSPLSLPVKRKSTTILEPISTASLEPKSTTSLEHKSTTSLEPKSTASLEPKSTTSFEPESTTSLEPMSTTSLEPTSTASIAPESTTSIAPESTTSIAPESTTRPEFRSTISPELPTEVGLSGNLLLGKENEEENDLGEDAIAPFAQRKRFKGKPNSENGATLEKEATQSCLEDSWQTLQQISLDDLLHKKIEDPLRLSQYNVGILLALNDMRVHLGASLEDLITWLERLLPTEFREKGLEPNMEKFSMYLLSVNSSSEALNSKILTQVLPEELFDCTRPIRVASRQENRVINKCFLEDVTEINSSKTSMKWEDFLAPVNFDDLLEGKECRVSWNDFNNGLLYALWKVNKFYGGDENNFKNWLSLTSTTPMKEKDYLAMAKAAVAIDNHLQSYPDEINRLVAPIVIRPKAAGGANQSKATVNSTNKNNIDTQRKETSTSNDDDIILEKEIPSPHLKPIGTTDSGPQKVVVSVGSCLASQTNKSRSQTSSQVKKIVKPSPRNLSGSQIARVSSQSTSPSTTNRVYAQSSSEAINTSLISVRTSTHNKNTASSEATISVTGVSSHSPPVSKNSNMKNIIRITSTSKLTPSESHAVNTTDSLKTPVTTSPKISQPTATVSTLMKPVSVSKNNEALISTNALEPHSVTAQDGSQFHLQNTQVNYPKFPSSETDLQNAQNSSFAKMMYRPSLNAGPNQAPGVPLIPVLNSGGYMTMVPLSLRMPGINNSNMTNFYNQGIPSFNPSMPAPYGNGNIQFNMGGPQNSNFNQMVPVNPGNIPKETNEAKAAPELKSGDSDIASKVNNLERQLQELQKQNSKLLEMNQKLIEKTLLDNVKEIQSETSVQSSSNSQSTSTTSSVSTSKGTSSTSHKAGSKPPKLAYKSDSSSVSSYRGRGGPRSSNAPTPNTKLQTKDVGIKRYKQSFEDALNYKYKK